MGGVILTVSAELLVELCKRRPPELPRCSVEVVEHALLDDARYPGLLWSEYTLHFDVLSTITSFSDDWVEVLAQPRFRVDDVDHAEIAVTRRRH